MKYTFLFLSLVCASFAQQAGYRNGQLVVQGGVNVCGTETGITNALVCATTTSPHLQAYTIGAHYQVLTAHACTAACTINIDSLGAKSIKLHGGATDPGSSDIPVGMQIDLVYDGTVMQLNTPQAGPLSTAYLPPEYACSSSASGGTTYACTLSSGAPNAYVDGEQYRFKADVNNTGSSTFNFATIGAKSIVKMTGGVTTALAAGDILAGQWVTLVYSLANDDFQMTAQLANAGLHSISFDIDGGGSVIATGQLKTFVPIDFTCSQWKRVDVTADQSGSVTVEVDKHNAAIPNTTTDKISASAPITLSAAQLSLNGSLTGWTGPPAVGDVFGFNVASAATVTHVHGTVWCQ